MDPQQSRKPYTYNYYASQQRAPAPVRNTPKKAPRRRLPRPVIGLVMLVILVVVIAHLLPNKTKADVKQVVHKATAHISSPPPAPSNLVPSAKLDAMGASINGIISQNSGIDMSVSLIDLNSNQAEHYGDTATFTAASTTKVITAAYFLHQVETGQESLGETINGSSAEYEIQQMIVISDDNAWDALNNHLGYPELQAYANSIGLSSFQSLPNAVTSDDMAHLMAKLYDNQLLDASHTQLLLSYLKQANYRQYIVPAVPAADTIYHKIGLYEDNVHDEAIVTNGTTTFVIVIFTNGHGAQDWPARAVMMQQITKAALATYF